RALQRSILKSKAERARQQSIGEKLMAGERLFAQVRERMKAGIQTRHPDWSSGQVHQEFLDILAKQRRHEEKGIYRLIGYLNDDGTMTPVKSVRRGNDDGE